MNERLLQIFPIHVINSESIVSLSSWFTSLSALHPIDFQPLIKCWNANQQNSVLSQSVYKFHNGKAAFQSHFPTWTKNAKLILTGSVECDGVVFTECICHYIKAIRHNVALKPKHKSHSCPLWFKLQRSHFHSVRWHLQNPKYNWLSSRV